MGRKDGASTSAAPLRKGPWMAEEDEVLIEHVRKYGPRDWSSIRTKGLLPRSGKSCRLRWVNKLKPDLKTGCKFSAEEERVVINLQEQLGNKWARIATHLPGRTDNDVKNFWSTRQKRLARMQRAQNAGNLEEMRERSHSLGHEQSVSFEANPQAIIPHEDQKHPYLLHPQPLRNLPPSDLPISYMAPCQPSDPWSYTERKPFFPTDPPPHFSSLQLPHSLLDLPLIPDSHHLATDFSGVDFPDFDFHGDPTAGSMPPTDSFFGDFPVDMLDGLDPPSNSPPP